MNGVAADLIVSGDPMLLNEQIAVVVRPCASAKKIDERVVIHYRAPVPVPIVVDRGGAHVVKLPANVVVTLVINWCWCVRAELLARPTAGVVVRNASSISPRRAVA